MARERKKTRDQTTLQRLRSLIKSCRDTMRKDKGLNGELDRLPQLTWMLFLKFLDDLEREDEARALLAGDPPAGIIPNGYRWRDWAAPADGITGDELIRFVSADEFETDQGERQPGLLAALRELPGSISDGRRSVVRRVFRGVNNRMTNGYLMREVVNKLDGISFTSQDEVHTLSTIYEGMLREMRDAAGDSGEFYTPRPLVALMVAVTDPRLGETVLDPAAGTGGFLVEAYEHLKQQVDRDQDRALLQKQTLYGFEPKSLPLMLCEMNLLLHGVQVPNVEEKNSLAVRLSELGDSDRFDVILTNPPFGGEEEQSVKQGFPADRQTSETALLFLQVIMRRLRRQSPRNSTGGRAAVVVPNGTLFAGGVAARIKADLLMEFHLHTILRLPRGVFAPYTDIQTNVLFFDRSGPTEEVWFYEHVPAGERTNYTKTKALKFEEFGPLLTWWTDREENDRAWKVATDELLVHEGGRLISVDLDRRNPTSVEELERRPLLELLDELESTQRDLSGLISELRSVTST